MAFKSIPLRTSEISPHLRYRLQPDILLLPTHSPRWLQKIGTSCLTRESKAKIQTLNIVLINFWYRSVKPVHYDISLWDLEFGGDWKYKGLVKIDTRIVKATKEIVLNAKELEIQGAKLWTAEAKSMSLH